MERNKECASCKYAEFVKVSEFGTVIASKIGVCRRYPPQPFTHLGHSEFEFPRLGPNDWCGEWEEKED